MKGKDFVAVMCGILLMIYLSNNCFRSLLTSYTVTNRISSIISEKHINTSSSKKTLMNENIIAGLISGLFVTIFAFAFRSFWNSVIVPWFEERVYKDIKIEGKWYGIHPEESNYRQEIYSLKRHGHNVYGTMICTNGPDEGEEYKVNGSFRNMILPLTYESTDSTKSDRGTITLITKQNGERLSGKIALYCTQSDEIITGTIILFRKQEELKRLLRYMSQRKEEMEKIRVERKRIEEKAKSIESESTSNLEQNNEEKHTKKE